MRGEFAVGVLVDDRYGRMGCSGVGVRVGRCAGTDQVLVVQERTAKRAFEEIVSEDVLLSQLVEVPTGCSRGDPWSDRRHPPAANWSFLPPLIAI